jgi:hypothetical protein
MEHLVRRFCPSEVIQSKKIKKSQDKPKSIKEINEQKLGRTKFRGGSQRARGRSKLGYIAKVRSELD